ncbi:MAG: FAD-dependent oxidoreductase [Steroidobacteraceae bacterium]
MSPQVLESAVPSVPPPQRPEALAAGSRALAWEFEQPELGADFVRKLWELLLRGDDLSAVLLRFIWGASLKHKRKFIRALEAHLADRYPMFKGLSQGWPAQNSIPPRIRPPDERAQDFALVNEGYLGYLNLGYSYREVQLLVWLEVLRDKQCDDRPCEIGIGGPGRKEARGGCPVKIHIPEMLDLMGQGRFRQALELIKHSNPLPNVTGRVCPQEIQCQGVCTHTSRPIEIGQLEWYLPQSEKHDPDAAGAAREPKAGNPWARADKPPIAVVGSGPAGLINAYLLLQEGFPVTVFEAFHELGGVLRYGIPEFRLPNSLIDDVVARIRELGGQFVTNFVVGKTATLESLKRAGFWKIFVGTGAGLPRFMNVPGEHLLGILSANEFLTRVNLMQAHHEGYETPLPETRGREVIVIGGGNTAMDAARTARRLGGRDHRLPARTARKCRCVEELPRARGRHQLKVLRAPCEFTGDRTHFVRTAVLEVNAPGQRRRLGPAQPGRDRRARDHASRPRDHGAGQCARPPRQGCRARAARRQVGPIEVRGGGGHETSIDDVYTGDAERGGLPQSRRRRGAAAREIIARTPSTPPNCVRWSRTRRALHPGSGSHQRR